MGGSKITPCVTIYCPTTSNIPWEIDERNFYDDYSGVLRVAMFAIVLLTILFNARRKPFDIHLPCFRLADSLNAEYRYTWLVQNFVLLLPFLYIDTVSSLNCYGNVLVFLETNETKHVKRTFWWSLTFSILFTRRRLANNILFECWSSGENRSSLFLYVVFYGISSTVGAYTCI